VARPQEYVNCVRDEFRTVVQVAVMD
jgi:hypothetical protein